MNGKYVDFSIVKPEHRIIDERLANWGRFCAGSGGAHSSEALGIARAVADLPMATRKVLQWAYVKQGSLKKLENEVRGTKEQIAQLLHDGRQILVDKGFGKP